MRKIMSEQTVRKIRLKGHETFILREGWLAKGLKAVSDNPKVFSEYAGADALGVGTNMAKAIRYWLRAGGVTAESLYMPVSHATQSLLQAGMYFLIK